MGPNGSGKSTLANAIMGHPSLEVTEGQILFDGEDITEADPDERARRAVHGLPVPGRDSGRDHHEVPADGHERPPRGARRGGDLAEGVPQDRRGRDGADQRPARVQLALPQRGLLRRREEAHGDPPARAAAAEARGARRDRLGPGHRRAQRRRPRRQHRRARRRHGRADHHPLPAHPAHGRARPRVDHVRRADRQGGRPGARRRARGPRATAGSARRSGSRLAPDGRSSTGSGPLTT